MATKKTVSRATVAPRMSNMDKKYQAQSDLRTMQEASTIQSDVKRMSAAQKEATNQMAVLSSIAKKK
jgi:hypothetical protein